MSADPRSGVTAFLVGAALADSVLEDDRVSAVLGLVHVGVFVWSGMWPCCRV